MQDLLNVVLLAVVQGLTEFLPVSSSGHLVIAQRLMGVEESGISLEVWLHFGTLTSIIFFYRHTLISLIRGVYAGEKKSLRLAGCILLSTFPAALLYLVCGDSVKRLYESSHFTGGFLVFTGLVLLGSHWIRCRDGEVTVVRAFVTGLAQALAILPGVSRSGMTISAARASGICPVRAAEFSFLMVIPLLTGAAVMDLMRVPESGEHIAGWLLFFGALVAATVGWVALKLLVSMLKKGAFWLFGIYCITIGLLSLLML